MRSLSIRIIAGRTGAVDQLSGLQHDDFCGRGLCGTSLDAKKQCEHDEN
jgi:hypothetical protein